jgi:hypothetical protein
MVYPAKRTTSYLVIALVGSESRRRLLNLAAPHTAPDFRGGGGGGGAHEPGVTVLVERQRMHRLVYAHSWVCYESLESRRQEQAMSFHLHSHTKARACAARVMC